MFILVVVAAAGIGKYKGGHVACAEIRMLMGTCWSGRVRLQSCVVF